MSGRAGRPSFAIRKAGPADAPAVLDLARALARTLGNPDDLLTEALVARDMVGTDTPMTVLLAEADGRAAGYVSLLPAFESSQASRGLYVADLFVAKGLRRRGVGRALLAAAADLASQSGCGHLWLVMQEDNQEADRFYRAIADIREPVVAHAVTGDNFAGLAADGALARLRSGTIKS